MQNNENPAVGDRIIIMGTCLRGVVAQRIDDVVMIYRDDRVGSWMMKANEVEALDARP